MARVRLQNRTYSSQTPSLLLLLAFCRSAKISNSVSTRIRVNEEKIITNRSNKQIVRLFRARTSEWPSFSPILTKVVTHKFRLVKVLLDYLIGCSLLSPRRTAKHDITFKTRKCIFRETVYISSVRSVDLKLGL